MKDLIFYNSKNVEKLVSQRPGEVKIGEKIGFVNDLNGLEDSGAKYVIFGIPEDVGIRANYGRPGAASAWEAFLRAFLNIQYNRYTRSSIVLLGEINASKAMEKAAHLDSTDPNYFQKLGDLVNELDEAVVRVVQAIVKKGKFPIIIGGGHNNSYGNLRGTSSALGKPVNAINIDAHTDYRSPEYRHSGNGFSYARKEGYLKKYAVFGLHENYTPEYIFEEFDHSEELSYDLLENFCENSIPLQFKKSLSFVKDEPFGMEIDCDGIAGFPSSAASPAGLKLSDLRTLVRITSREKNCAYLHLCEAVDHPGFLSGKALAYLVSDFIKKRKN